jgi:uncharacterized membrane protein
MPDLGFLHPIVVHFAVALLVVGVLLRLVALTGKLAFANHAAFLLLVLGTLAAVVAVPSGHDAHEAAEGIPGAGPLVREHEELGERTRNLFVVVALVEIAALIAFSRKPKLARGLRLASALAGIGGGVVLYEAAEHGGELVYSWAGGVGTRTGAPEDVGRLLVAGLYQQAELDREAGHPDAAAKLIAVAGQRFPDIFDVQLMYAGSLLDDANDPPAALALLRKLPAPGEGFPRLRHGLLLAKALQATGALAEGRQVLDGLVAEFPNSRRLKQTLEQYPQSP